VNLLPPPRKEKMKLKQPIIISVVYFLVENKWNGHVKQTNLQDKSLHVFDGSAEHHRIVQAEQCVVVSFHFHLDSAVKRKRERGIMERGRCILVK
jgi:hypothetical protein